MQCPEALKLTLLEVFKLQSEPETPFKDIVGELSFHPIYTCAASVSGVIVHAETFDLIKGQSP